MGTEDGIRKKDLSQVTEETAFFYFLEKKEKASSFSQKEESEFAGGEILILRGHEEASIFTMEREGNNPKRYWNLKRKVAPRNTAMAVHSLRGEKDTVTKIQHKGEGEVGTVQIKKKVLSKKSKFWKRGIISLLREKKKGGRAEERREAARPIRAGNQLDPVPKRGKPMSRGGRERVLLVSKEMSMKRGGVKASQASEKAHREKKMRVPDPVTLGKGGGGRREVRPHQVFCHPPYVLRGKIKITPIAGRGREISTQRRNQGETVPTGPRIRGLVA